MLHTKRQIKDDAAKRIAGQHIANRNNMYRVMGEVINRESGEKVMYDFGSNAWIEPFKREYEGLYESIGIIEERQGVLAYERQDCGWLAGTGR